MTATPSRDFARLGCREYAVDEFACLDRETGFRHASRSGPSHSRIDMWWDGRRSKHDDPAMRQDTHDRDDWMMRTAWLGRVTTVTIYKADYQQDLTKGRSDDVMKRS